jgi:hypothetical protein
LLQALAMIRADQRPVSQTNALIRAKRWPVLALVLIPGFSSGAKGMAGHAWIGRRSWFEVDEDHSLVF